ncbi:MAG: ABC transporter substrate-binding protein, partial [Pseudomonadota bacterium]|nr:ABC transporter substrate-binding protein [Pseudomonadota bacterium]
FDDQNNPAKAKEIALQIAQQQNIIAVIGHYTSPASLAAAPVYQHYGLAAVTGSATADKITQNRDTYFRITFNNGDQGALLANYVRKMLNYEAANIVFVDNAYGATLADTFIKTSNSVGLEVTHQWSFNPNEAAALKQCINKMVADLNQASDADPAILFIATHADQAAEIITHLRQRVNQEVPIVGADSLAGDAFLDNLRAYPQERTKPGYYTDGIYVVAPFLLDIANQKAQDFFFTFTKRYGEQPTISSAIYYDAAAVLLEGISNAELLNYNNINDKRKKVINGLWKISNFTSAIEGVTGYIYFNKHGDAVKQIPIGVYRESRLGVAFYQYQPLAELRHIDNLLREVLDGRIVLANDKFLQKTQIVYAGIDFNEVGSLNVKDSSFSADFYLWFRFKEEEKQHFEDDDIEFVNAVDSSIGLGEPILENYSAIEGTITRAYRIKSEFKSDFNFSNYPLDQQTLPIRFRHLDLTRNSLIYVIDAVGMNSDNGQGNKSKVFSLEGWNINKISFFQNVKKADSSLGVPELFGSQRQIEYSQFNATIDIKRLLINFVVKNLLPVVLLIILGYVSFFVPATTATFSPRLTLSVNVIIATSLFHLRLSSELPDVGYIVLMEYLFYTVYGLAILTITISVISHLYILMATNKSDQVVRYINLIGKILYPLIVLIAFFIVYFVGES